MKNTHRAIVLRVIDALDYVSREFVWDHRSSYTRVAFWEEVSAMVTEHAAHVARVEEEHAEFERQRRSLR